MPTRSSTSSTPSATGSSASSDVGPWLAFAVTAAMAAAMVAWSQYLFRTGRRLKP